MLAEDRLVLGGESEMGKGGPEGLPPLQEGIGLRQGCLASWDVTALPIRVASTSEARLGVAERAPEPLVCFRRLPA